MALRKEGRRMMKYAVVVWSKIEEFKNDERGASLVEYGLLVGLIAVVAIATITTVGTDIEAMFSDVADALGE
jgi:pilus assembly protein Flp/PilA